MVKVTIEKGLWQRTNRFELIYHEHCPNANCKTQILYYSEDLVGPNCPDCKSRLIGKDLKEDHNKQMAYHLEV